MGQSWTGSEPLVVDSVTDLTEAARGLIVACGSHGGEFSARYALYRGVRGAVFNDAGIGRDAAGTAGLHLLDSMGVPAGAVSHLECRIGRGQDTAKGRLAHVNDAAGRLGLRIGSSFADASRAISARENQQLVPHYSLGPPDPTGRLLRYGNCEVWVLDSASLIGPEHEDAIVVTGSHGGLPGGRPERAVKAAVRGAVFHDAGGGKDDAGWARLRWLDQEAIPAVAVAARSARIGDGVSVYETGRISHVNRSAERLGVRPDWTTRRFVRCVVDQEQD